MAKRPTDIAFSQYASCIFRDPFSVQVIELILTNNGQIMPYLDSFEGEDLNGEIDLKNCRYSKRIMVDTFRAMISKTLNSDSEPEHYFLDTKSGLIFECVIYGDVWHWLFHSKKSESENIAVVLEGDLSRNFFRKVLKYAYGVNP